MAKEPLEVQNRTTNDAFGKFAAAASGWLGSKWAFAGAASVIVIWAAVGPIFNFSDTWQLVIKHGHNHRHVSNGLFDPEHAEPGRPCD